MDRSPGPLPFPTRPLDSRARAALGSLFEDVDRETARRGWVCSACGACCRFREHGHELWLTEVELAFLLDGAGAREPARGGVCPYLHGNACGARESRVLGCRLFFCQAGAGEVEAVFEGYFERLLEILKELGLEPAYGELLASLAPRR